MVQPDSLNVGCSALRKGGAKPLFSLDIALLCILVIDKRMGSSFSTVKKSLLWEVSTP
jgi:hypothetical protein